jgi:hypothetical protein
MSREFRFGTKSSLRSRERLCATGSNWSGVNILGTFAKAIRADGSYGLGELQDSKSSSLGRKTKQPRRQIEPADVAGRLHARTRVAV